MAICAVDSATLNVILAPLRADVALYEDYRWVEDDAKLAGMRVLVIGATKDPEIPVSSLYDWKTVAGPSATTSVYIVEGAGHFHMVRSAQRNFLGLSPICLVICPCRRHTQQKSCHASAPP